MYGSKTEDPIVRYYDETVGTSGKREVEWYLTKAHSFGDPILDIACGTGRMSILLAKKGHNIVAFDRFQCRRQMSMSQCLSRERFHTAFENFEIFTEIAGQLIDIPLRAKYIHEAFFALEYLDCS